MCSKYHFQENGFLCVKWPIYIYNIIIHGMMKYRKTTRQINKFTSTMPSCGGPLWAQKSLPQIYICPKIPEKEP